MNNKFIKGSILLRLWADQPEILRRGSWFIDLQSEWWRSDLEIRTAVFQSENRASVLMCFLCEQFWSWAPIKVNQWFDWADFWWAHTFKTHWSSFWTVKIGFEVQNDYISVREQSLCLVRFLHYVYAKLLKLPRLICLEIWLMYASSFI